MAKARKPYKALTRSGIDRKMNRLIVKQLQDMNPALYEQLKEQAMQRIIKDNNDPLTDVMMMGLGMVHEASYYIEFNKKLADKERRMYLVRNGDYANG